MALKPLAQTHTLPSAFVFRHSQLGELSLHSPKNVVKFITSEQIPHYYLEMSQSTGADTDFFSPLIVFGTDVLVLVLVQFSSTDSVLVLITQVLSQSVPVPTR